jgi:hypothetical protein
MPHPFDQYEHFNQVEPFEKPQFVVVWAKGKEVDR